jgi:hypothetical protein
MDTECWNCLQPFGNHCTADDGCPKPTNDDGEWTGFYRHMHFLNLEATPVNPHTYLQDHLYKEDTF